MTTATYEAVLELAQRLSPEEQLQLIEDLEDICAADAAEREDPIGLPLEEARTEVERERATHESPRSKAAMSEPQYLVDAAGNTTAVLLDLETYNALVEAAEELEDIREYVEVRRALDAGEETVRPVEEAFADYEARHPDLVEHAD